MKLSELVLKLMKLADERPDLLNEDVTLVGPYQSVGDIESVEVQEKGDGHFRRGVVLITDLNTGL